MCGICGFIDYSLDHQSIDEKKETLIRMNKSLEHRGPDGSNIYVNSDFNFYLGHTRLSIQDLTSNGNQPMYSENNNFVISFNGEIYNHFELRKELNESYQIKWRGRSDTETLLACFENWGVKKTLKKVEGMFAIALLDIENKYFYLIRDRAGEKPIFYFDSNKYLIFASEIKSLKQHPFFVNDINNRALSKFIKVNYIPSPDTIYNKVKKLPPGSYLKISLSQGTNDLIKSNRYEKYWDSYNINKSFSKIYTPGNEVQMFDDLMCDVIKKQMISDVPLGIFLSGGIDSSLIASIMQRVSDKKIQTFTIGFENDSYDESKYARKVAQALNTEHNEYILNENELVNIIPMLNNTFDEPFADKAQIPAMLISKMAREKVTVALSGDGGDELFAGYSRYKVNNIIWNYINNSPGLIVNILKYLLEKVAFLPNRLLIEIINFVLKKLSIGEINRNQIERLIHIISSKSRFELYEKSINHQMNLNRLIINDEIGNIFDTSQINKSNCKNFIEEMMLIDFNHYLPDDILTKLDRSAMNYSLETRVPLLNHRVIEYASSIPFSYKVNKSDSKWIMKRLLKKYIPDYDLNRAKAGFNLPIDEWLRGPLRDITHDMLEKNKIHNEGYFDSNIVNNIMNEHMTMKRDWHYLIWNLLSFEIWLSNES